MARQERSVEEFDVCEALRATRSDDDLVGLVGSESISVDGGFVDSEDAAVAHCNVSPKGNRDLGLRGTTWVRVTCRPGLTVDAVLTSGNHATVEPDTLVDVLHDVLVNVSQQG